jgi:hypothetical protein
MCEMASGLSSSDSSIFEPERSIVRELPPLLDLRAIVSLAFHRLPSLNQLRSVAGMRLFAGE